MSFNETNIRWTDYTSNPVHGCSKTGSPGCANCYAEWVSHKFETTVKPWLRVNAETDVQLKEHFLADRLQEPAWAFANSMSDLFHEFVEGVFDAIPVSTRCLKGGHRRVWRGGELDRRRGEVVYLNLLSEVASAEVRLHDPADDDRILNNLE